ncbi:topoisomerase DNA-binding C4 zinc finger domain-containing protein [Aromatoleum toluolicum]|uniref:DNA topoisomerase type IA zn finger domain-containing protein n=1 Tax=Aromatoleum toluolicum TaxID=90060 RepID=A0ABX1NI31_9RHOO|nr:topoisomerase DNA-binding C4 zinc finger domain-containing protein [Aromatoleum toluolicum]NMF98951.1 topoisomerase DNA-binding C4 zinc finger domain-containing protein [Aromatoleum toluolicum]
MARRKSGILEVLMEIAAHLPWQVGVGLAVIAYFVLHYFATQVPLPSNPAELKALGKTMGDSMVHGLWTTIAGVLQYVVPVALLVGAGVSAKRRHGRKDPAGSEALACPKCGGAMVRRTAKSGSNAGNEFWGCAKYPACRGVRN